jgi:hypothetical protein
MTLPSHEQLTRAMAAMPRHALEAKLASGELTAVAQAIAMEELKRRDQEGEPLELAQVGPHDRVRSAESPSSESITGWSASAWAIAFGLSLLVVLFFGSTAKNKADQSFLYGVIVVQAALLAGLSRVVVSVFSSSRSLGLLGKFLAGGAICFALFALTMCSAISQSGWKGG